MSDHKQVYTFIMYNIDTQISAGQDKYRHYIRKGSLKGNFIKIKKELDLLGMSDY